LLEVLLDRARELRTFGIEAVEFALGLADGIVRITTRG
jgi:hypothetical protein